MSNGIYRYVALVGTAELVWYGGDDNDARRKVARWLSLFWEKYRVNSHKDNPGSLDDAINNGWYDRPPTVKIARLWCDNTYVVPCKDYTYIERWPIVGDNIKDFRAWSDARRGMFCVSAK